MDQAPNFEEMPYAPWLEDTVRIMSEHKIKSVALAAILDDEGEILTAYYMAGMADKAVMATHINADALYDMVIANARGIVAAAEAQELEEENGEDD